MAALFVPTIVAPAAARAEGPVDFGLAELHRVIEERGLNPRSFQVAVEYSLVLPADGFQIQGQIIRGGSRRGVMYGLLEAADQLRERKALVHLKATPRFEMRSARLRGSDEVLARPEREWSELFTELARARFNRLRIEVPELTAERSVRLARIAPLAEEHAIDLALKLTEIDAPMVLKLLGESIVFKAVQVPGAAAATALTTLSEAGRFVTLDLAADDLTADLRKEAQEMRVPLLTLSASASGPGRMYGWPRWRRRKRGRAGGGRGGGIRGGSPERELDGPGAPARRLVEPRIHRRTRPRGNFGPTCVEEEAAKKRPPP